MININTSDININNDINQSNIPEAALIYTTGTAKLFPIPNMEVNLSWGHYYPTNVTEYTIYRFRERLNEDFIDVDKYKPIRTTSEKTIIDRIYLPGEYYYYVISKNEYGYNNEIYDWYNERMFDASSFASNYIFYTIFMGISLSLLYFIIIRPALRCKEGGEGSYFCPGKKEKKKEKEYLDRKKRTVRLS